MAIVHRIQGAWRATRLLRPASPAAPDHVIQPPVTGLSGYLREVWANRRFIRFFGRRALHHRSKRAILGWFWLVLRSLLFVLPFSFVVGSVAGVSPEGVPYPLFILVGLSLWNFFANGITFVTRSLRFDRDVLTQLCIPHMVVVIASLGPVIFEFAIGMTLVYAIGLYYYGTTGVFFLGVSSLTPLALLFVALTALLALGIGLVTSVFDDYATDTRFLVPYLLSLWMLLTPVIYPVAVIPERWRWVAWLNPMAAIVEGFRKTILDVGHLDALSLCGAAVSALLTFVAGAWFFVRAVSRAGLRS